MPDVKVHFTSTADTQGAERQAAALDRVTAAAGRAQAATTIRTAAQVEAFQAELQHNEVMQEADAALKKQAQSQAKANEQMEKGVLHGGAFKKLLHAVSEQSPLAGLAIKAAFSIPGAVMAAAVMAFQTIKDHFRQLNEAMQVKDLEAFTDRAKRLSDALLDNSLAAASAAEHFKVLARQTDTASEAVDRFDQIQNALLTQEEKIAAARKKVALARVAHITNPVERARATLAIEEEFAAGEKARADTKARFDLSENYRKLANEEIAAKEMQRVTLPAARARAAKLGTPQEIKQQFDEEKGRLDVMQSEQARLDAEYKQMQEEYGAGYLPHPLLAGRMNANRTAAEELGPRIVSQLGLVQKKRTALPGRMAAAQAAQDEVARITAEANAAEKRANELRRQLPTLQTVDTINAGTRNRVFNFDAEARRLENSVPQPFPTGGGYMATPDSISAQMLEELRGIHHAVRSSP